jgi:hypothetical protein
MENLLRQRRAFLHKHGIGYTNSDREARSNIEAEAEASQWGSDTKHLIIREFGAICVAIKKEKIRVGESMDKKLDDLDWMNQFLSALGRAKEPSKGKARASLKKVYINIYDMEEGKYDKLFKSLSELRKYSIKERLIYPLKKAKGSNLKAFLKPLFGGAKPQLTA